MAGVGTAGLEVLDALPDIDAVFCPVGGGSSAAGYCLTVSAVADANVVGVQSAAAPAMYRAWAEDTLKPHDRMETIAEGLATSVPFAMTTRLLRDRLDDFRLVDDEAMLSAVRGLYEEEHVLMEVACAASVAALLEAGDELAGRTVVLPVSGRNLNGEKLQSILAG